MTPNTENTAGSDCQQRFVRISSYSAEARKDKRGRFYIHPLTGERVNEPAEGWPKHSFSFTPIKIRLPDDPDLIEKTEDGEVVYVHAEECGSFCDYACNPDGDRQAEILNDDVDARGK